MSVDHFPPEPSAIMSAHAPRRSDFQSLYKNQQPQNNHAVNPAKGGGGSIRPVASKQMP